MTSLVWIVLTLAVIYLFVRAGTLRSRRTMMVPAATPGVGAAVHAISREEFDAYNPFRAAGSEQLLREVEWYADERRVVLGVIALDLEDRDYFVGVLGRDTGGVFRAIDVDAAIATLDEARAALMSKIQAAVASGETVFPQGD